MCAYLHKHDHTFAQNLTDGHFVIVIALEDLFFQKLACSQVEGLTWPVEPAAIEPLLTSTHKQILDIKCKKNKKILRFLYICINPYICIKQSV